MATDAAGSESSFDTSDAVASSPGESHLAMSPAARSTWSPGATWAGAGVASSSGSDEPTMTAAATTVHRRLEPG